MKILKKSFWTLSSVFWGIMFSAVLVGGGIANQYAGQINSFLNINSYISVDDGDNSTPDVMYYKSDYIATRWRVNPTTGLYELQYLKNSDLARSHAVNVSKNVDTEGTVLLWNNGVLPLAANSNISLFGVSSFSANYITTGEGSGFHTSNTEDTLQESLANNQININPTLNIAYESIGLTGSYRHATKGGFAFDPNYVEFSVNECPFDKIKEQADQSIESYKDAAVFIISREGSENGDTDFATSECLDNNYQDLTKEEADILANLVTYKQQGKLSKIVLVLNTCNAMQFKHIKDYDIDACVWTGPGGTASYKALADVLSGKADPSGRLVDTYLYDSFSAPSTVNMGDATFTSYNGLPSTATYSHNSKYLAYQEGIYVGYKYFETRYEDLVMNQGSADGTFGAKQSVSNWNYAQEVAYPFGHGGSYAKFEKSNFKVVDKGTELICSINTKNISDTYQGQDVFQVYLQKPYTAFDKENGIEKSSVELVGFNKTDVLNPGEIQTLNVTIDKSLLASYDSYVNKTYILEAGDYYLSSGEDSHNGLNNILAKKGFGKVNGMDEDGNGDFASKYIVAKDDLTTYATSQKTGKQITNQFDNADINLYKGTKDQGITYLSRSNWSATYPTQMYQMKCTDQDFIKDMQYGGGEVKLSDSGEFTMPKYNQDNNLTLISLLYENYDSPLWDKLLEQMSYEEQCKLTTWGSNAMAGAASVASGGAKVMDGPAGLRMIANSVAYPSETIMAATFNTKLIEKLGNAFGMELLDVGYNGLYGPGANIHRNNFSGRNFEYYSEDGFLSGEMLNAEVAGLHNRGVITFMKHFVMNDQERNRYGVSIWANEQTIREVYLKAFQKVCEKDNSVGLMSSFNRIGATWSGNHKGLLTNVLRNEWGFKGVVETDAAVGNHMTQQLPYVNGVLAGQDLWMAGTQDNVYGEYRNNPEVATAIKQAAKNNLYAQVHSNCINGIKSGTKFIEITPWWKNVISGVQVGTGIVTGIAVLLAVASFIVPVIKKKRSPKA